MIWLVLNAWALEPEVGFHAMGGLSNTADGVPLLFGAGGQVAIDPLRRLHVEFAVDAGVTTAGSLWAGFGPRVRLYAGKPENTVLSGFAGGGLGIGRRGARPLIEGGFAVDLLKSNGPRPRLQATYAWEIDSASRLLIGIGAQFGRKAPPVEAPPPPPVPEPAPAPEPEPTPITLQGDGMIWVPGPVCKWLPGDEASAEIERLGMTLTKLTAISPRTVADPTFDPLEEQAPAEAKPGRIALSAFPGDQVLMKDETYPVTTEVLVLDHADGRADLEVVGGGRRVPLVVGVVEDTVVWVEVDPPDPQRVLFGNNSSELDAVARATIQSFADDLGDWRVEVHGSASPEGSATANDRLGRGRAQSVYDALLAVGVPAERIVQGEPKPPLEGLPAAEQRNATLTPLEAK